MDWKTYNAKCDRWHELQEQAKGGMDWDTFNRMCELYLEGKGV